MSKELTEKWLKGDLADEGVYYWKISDGQELIKSQLAMFAYRLCIDAEKVECLAPVPSYDELQKLEKKLEIVTKALEDIVKDYDRNGSCEEDCVGEYMCGTAIKALKEMGEVK